MGQPALRQANSFGMRTVNSMLSCVSVRRDSALMPASRMVSTAWFIVLDKDADIFEELYNVRLVRGLVIENRIDELFGLRHIQRTLYDRIGRGVQLI